MSAQAKVTSVEALETFRAALIVFMSRARRAADEAADEVRRTRLWLQHEQRTYWEGEVRKRRRALAAAEQELFSAKLSALRDTTTAQEKAVTRAKEAVTEAEEKLRRVKVWNRDFDGRADPLVKKLQNLRDVVDHDLPQGVAYLVQALRTLEAYRESGPIETAPPAPAENPAAE